MVFLRTAPLKNTARSFKTLGTVWTQKELFALPRCRYSSKPNEECICFQTLFYFVSNYFVIQPKTLTIKLLFILAFTTRQLCNVPAERLSNVLNCTTSYLVYLVLLQQCGNGNIILLVSVAFYQTWLGTLVVRKTRRNKVESFREKNSKKNLTDVQIGEWWTRHSSSITGSTSVV